MGSGSDGNSGDSERNEYKEKPFDINLKIKNPGQVQIHCHGKTLSLSSMLREKDEHHVAAVAEEKRKLQRISDELIERVLKQEIALENKKRRLDSWSEELNKREEFLERERQKLEEEKMKKEEDAHNQKGLEHKWSFEYQKEKLRYDEIRHMPKMWQEAFKKLIAV